MTEKDKDFAEKYKRRVNERVEYTVFAEIGQRLEYSGYHCSKFCPYHIELHSFNYNGDDCYCDLYNEAMLIGCKCEPMEEDDLFYIIG